MQLLVRRILAGALTSVMCVTPALAVTSNDIRWYYGLRIEKDAAPLISEMQELSQEMREAKAAEVYNGIVEDIDLESINASIDTLASELRELADMLENCIDMDIDQMLGLEMEYTRKESEINQLLQLRDALGQYSPIELERDSAELQLSVEQLQAEIEQAGVFEDIGTTDFWPAIGVAKKVNSEFGSRWDPVTNASYSFHQGLDIYAPMGTPVGSLFSGEVYSTGNSSGSGLYIYVDHGNGVKTFYCHLSEILVKKGDVVEQGDVIAKSGNTGYRTTGPHLHLGVYIDGSASNPRKVLPDV